MLIQTLKKLQFPDILLCCILLFSGGFHEYISCVVSIITCLYLIYRLSKSHTIVIKKNFLSLNAVLICAFYGLSCIWAIHTGMAIIGFFKFLPLILFLLCLWQTNNSALLKLLPYVGAIMVLISAIGMYIEPIKPFFAVGDRLAGLFQYPNSFAIFLLVCELLLLTKENKNIWDIISIFVLLTGILLTGSRTVFILFILSNIITLFFVKKRTAIIVSVLLAVALAVIICIALIFENSVFHRLITISLTESTFVGRFLYFKDALSLLVKHPFGMGYMGYYFTQHSIQTGVYSVMFAHNDFLQLALDIGIIPAVVFIALIIFFLFKRSVSTANIIIVCTLCAHTLFDFNFQFLGILLLLFSIMDNSYDCKCIYFKKNTLFRILLPIIIITNLYMGSSLVLSHLGHNELSDSIYPYNTQNKITMLEQVEDINAANVLADEILAQNTHCYIPYSVKAKYSYTIGDFKSVIDFKNTVFTLNPFEYSEYEEYCEMLIKGLFLYEQSGDIKSAEICKQELLRTQVLLESNQQRLSYLGSLIDDQPITNLSYDISQFIQQIE